LKSALALIALAAAALAAPTSDVYDFGAGRTFCTCALRHAT